MQFFFGDPYYDLEQWEPGKYLRELKELLLPLDSEVEAASADIGHGADLPCVLVEIFRNFDWKIITGGSLVGLFLLGEKINKNLDAWVAIYKKVATLVEKLKPARIDENVAIVLVLGSLAEKGDDLSSAELGLQIVPFFPGPKKSKFKLETQPDSLYIISVKLTEKFTVVGMKSSGDIVFQHEFSTQWYEF